MGTLQCTREDGYEHKEEDMSEDKGNSRAKHERDHLKEPETAEKGRKGLCHLRAGEKGAAILGRVAFSSPADRAGEGAAVLGSVSATCRKGGKGRCHLRERVRHLHPWTGADGTAHAPRVHQPMEMVWFVSAAVHEIATSTYGFAMVVAEMMTVPMPMKMNTIREDSN